MKRMTLREVSQGRKIKIHAKKTYRSNSGDWIAEVDEKEYRKACSFVCQGVINCVWDELQVQADLDDDGKEYKVVKK